MYKKLITLSLLISSLIVIGGCNSFSQQQQIDQLQEELNTFKANNSGVVVGAEQAEQQRLEAELAALKARQNSNTTNTVVNNPAPVIVAPTQPKFGPGNGNHMNGSFEGQLTIHTNSANGKLTLRNNPDQNSPGYIEIPNGTSEINFYNKVKVGDYVWYEVGVAQYQGYLRGDYVDVPNQTWN